MSADPARPGTVALVIPCYQQAHFLGTAIESALRQTHKFDEIIVVDDGSTDDPASVVSGFPGVRLIRRENGGLSAARNTGLFAATSEFIVFLDSDDLLTDQAVEHGLKTHQRNPGMAFVYGAYQMVDADLVETTGLVYTPAPQDTYKAFLENNCVGMCATVMYRRVIFDQVGPFDEDLRRCEDHEIYLRITRTHPIASHGNLTALYRRHDAAMSVDYGVMLKAVLHVNDMQRPQTQADPDLEAARQRGRAHWHTHFAIEAMGGLRSTFRQHRFSKETFAKARDVLRFGRRCGYWRLLWVTLKALPRQLRKRAPKVVGMIRKANLGDLDTVKPKSTIFGFDRGTPVDRRYIAAVMTRHADAIKGRALEVMNDGYCREFGADRITQQDILNLDPAPQATIVGDICDPDLLPDAAFDCIVFTQTLHLIYDFRAALRHIHAALKPGGVLIMTVPGITPLEQGANGQMWNWSFTPTSVRRLIDEIFGPGAIIDTYGNVYAATAYLHGLAVEEIDAAKLDHQDPAYPMIIGVAATKTAGA